MFRRIATYTFLALTGGGTAYYLTKSARDRSVDEVALGISNVISSKPDVVKEGDKEQVVTNVCGELLPKLQEDCKILFEMYYADFVAGRKPKIDYLQFKKQKIDMKFKKKKKKKIPESE